MSEAAKDSQGREIVVGMELGPLERETGFETWNRYAAVNSEFVPIHMDDEAGKAAGMGAAFGMGSLQTSYLHILVRDWMGESGKIEKLSLQFRKPNAKGPITVTGTVTAVSTDENGRTIAELELVSRDAAGDALAPGNATVAFA